MEELTPLISIIVPNYNHEKFLQQRLDSVFNQTYPNFEVILLDDCSTDSSREILLQYSNHANVSHCVFNDKNTGNTFEQWNKGIALAKGEFIWIAETDDFSANTFLEVVSKPLIKNGDLSVSYCQSNRVNENGIITGNWKTHTDDLDPKQFRKDFIMDGPTFIERFLIYKNVIPNASGVLLRKNKLIEIGNLELDPFLRYCGDWFIYFKLLVNNKVAFSPKNLNNFRHHTDSVIAKASDDGILNANNVIEIQLRKKMKIVLEKKMNLKCLVIQQTNNLLANKLIYGRAFLLYRKGKKIKSYILIIKILPYFLKRYFSCYKINK